MHSGLWDRQILDDITLKKEQVLESLNRYDHQVQKSLGPVFSSTNSFKYLVEVEKVPQPEASTISRQVGELRSLVESIRQQGKKNETLVSRMQQGRRTSYPSHIYGFGTRTGLSVFRGITFSGCPRLGPHIWLEDL